MTESEPLTRTCGFGYFHALVIFMHALFEQSQTLFARDTAQSVTISTSVVDYNIVFEIFMHMSTILVL